MFRHMRMPNQLTYKGKKTTCTHQLKVRLHHIEIENRQCYKWVLLTFWSLWCKFIKKRHCSYHKLNSKVKMCLDHLPAYAIFLSLYAKFEGSSVINKCISFRGQLVVPLMALKLTFSHICWFAAAQN